MLSLVFLVAIASLGFALWLAFWVVKQGVGPDEMQPIASAIRNGAEAFLRRQYRCVALLSILLGGAIYLLYAFLRSPSLADPAAPAAIALYASLSFLIGAVFSGLAGYFGIWVNIRCNVRSAAAARESLNGTLQLAIRGGAVSGISVVALSLLGVGGLYAVLVKLLHVDPQRIPFLIVGYALGASCVALFAQLGGGIYAKAADVGADVLGNVEGGIPADDSRNPAIIADLVGDNAGDGAGRGADLFESTAAENIGAMILGVGLYPFFGLQGILFPLVVRAFGLLASIIGIMTVRCRENEDPMKALNRGFFGAALMATGGFGYASWWLLRSEKAPDAWLYFFGCGLIGVLMSVAFVAITKYYTGDSHRPVRSIAEAATAGPAATIMTGIAVAMECTAAPILVISAALIGSYKLGAMTGIPHAGLFGTAAATMGMLGTAAYILAIGASGPIADNALGIVKMSHQPEEVRQRAYRLDAVGKTTRALAKGYAIGSAALAAFLLFSAYLDEIRVYGAGIDVVNIARPEVFVGALLGAMLVFLFSALAIKGVGKTTKTIIAEARRQFAERPEIATGKEKPDYGAMVDIVTKGSLKAMVAPSLLAVCLPVLTGLLFRGDGAYEIVAAFLMVGTIVGILLATMLNNGGGAFQRARKCLGPRGGKESYAYKATVVGDTVGGPFKDTAGPSIHVLVKLISTVMLVAAPFFL